MTGRATGGEWPVRSGLVPPVAEGFVARTETVPRLEAALVSGATVALVTGLESAGVRQGRPGPCGKTQLAAYVAEASWRSPAVDMLAWVGAASPAREEYAAACLAAGNAAEAIRCYRQLLAGRERLHGPAHPATLFPGDPLTQALRQALTEITGR